MLPFTLKIPPPLPSPAVFPLSVLLLMKSVPTDWNNPPFRMPPAKALPLLGRATLRLKVLSAATHSASSHKAHRGAMPRGHLIGEYCQLLTRLRA